MGRSKKKILAMHAAKKPGASFLRTMLAKQEQRVIDLLLEMEIDANEGKVHYRYLPPCFPKDNDLTYSMKELDGRKKHFKKSLMAKPSLTMMLSGEE